MKDLYLMKDGTHADPSDCFKGKDGVLQNKNGMPVAIDATGNPETISTGDKPAPAPEPVVAPMPVEEPVKIPHPAAIPAKEPASKTARK